MQGWRSLLAFEEEEEELGRPPVVDSWTCFNSSAGVMRWRVGVVSLVLEGGCDIGDGCCCDGRALFESVGSMWSGLAGRGGVQASSDDEESISSPLCLCMVNNRLFFIWVDVVVGIVVRVVLMEENPEGEIVGLRRRLRRCVCALSPSEIDVSSSLEEEESDKGSSTSLLGTRWHTLMSSR